MSFLNIGFSSIGHVLLVELCLLLGHVSGHPASGIVVDARGNIYFIDSGNGVMKLDTKREMTVVQRVPDGHWLTIDEAGALLQIYPKVFSADHAIRCHAHTDIRRRRRSPRRCRGWCTLLRQR